MNKQIFVCTDNAENILTCIYNVFDLRKKQLLSEDFDIIISLDGSFDIELFAEYIYIETDIDKAFKTINHIKKRLGEDVYDTIIKVLCHYDITRGYILYSFLEACFKNGRSYAENLADPYVMKMLELSRKSWNESHHFKGFIRFNEIYGILYAEIEPKCNVIPLVIEHFENRYPAENWIIRDTKRNLYAIHKAHRRAGLVFGDFGEFNDIKNAFELNHKDNYADLWQTFFNAIAIEERKNPQCQRNLLPLWMRKNMIEF